MIQTIPSRRLMNSQPLIIFFLYSKQLYLNGNAASDVLIEGGSFVSNKALESGGAIASWGDPTVVKITGGNFENNHAM